MYCISIWKTIVFAKTWEIELGELKELMKCTANTYKAFFRFNGLILSKCLKKSMKKPTVNLTMSQ